MSADVVSLSVAPNQEVPNCLAALKALVAEIEAGLPVRAFYLIYEVIDPDNPGFIDPRWAASQMTLSESVFMLEGEKLRIFKLAQKG